ncbi:MAG: DegT/DnrJ/EryC1/StrS family aminotransferase [Pseudomonadota bacterium]
MKIDFAKLQHQYQLYKQDIDRNIQAVLDKSNYILGDEVTTLEAEISTFTGLKHSLACSNGTDALLLAMMALDIKPGDEIITTPFTFIATAETIAYLQATPVFVDIQPNSFNIDPTLIERAITDKTRAIMPVSLYGQPADMKEINEIANKHGLKVIIDGAQSFGSNYDGISEAFHSDIYTTSFFPAKPLGCYGDGGAVLTDDDELAERVRMMRVHGQNKRYHHKYIGIGGRLDTLQAAVLLAKFPHYADEIKSRQRVAAQYQALLENTVVTPRVSANRDCVWAQYTVRVEDRDRIQSEMSAAGVPTAVHYPMSLHQQECFAYLGLESGSFPVSEQAAQEVVSLPMNPFLTEDEVQYVADNLLQSASGSQ